MVIERIKFFTMDLEKNIDNFVDTTSPSMVLWNIQTAEINEINAIY